MPGRSTNLDNGRARDILAVGAGEDCSDIFFLSPIDRFSFLSPSLSLEWMDR